MHELASKAPNRRKLYDILQKVYDLPNYGTAVTTDYLKDIMKENSVFLKVKRDQTHTIPKGTRRNFNSIDTLHWLVKVLREKGKPECGFTSWVIPNIEWMLRMIIWADPEQKPNICKTLVRDQKRSEKNNIEDKSVNIDPE